MVEGNSKQNALYVHCQRTNLINRKRMLSVGWDYLNESFVSGCFLVTMNVTSRTQENSGPRYTPAGPKAPRRHHNSWATRLLDFGPHGLLEQWVEGSHQQFCRWFFPKPGLFHRVQEHKTLNLVSPSMHQWECRKWSFFTTPEHQQHHLSFPSPIKW